MQGGSTIDPDLLEEEVRATAWDPALLGRLLRYTFPYWPRLAAGAALVIVTSFLAVTPPLLIGALVDVVFLAERSLPGETVSGFIAAAAPGLDAAGFAALPPLSKLWLFAGLFLAVRLAAFFVDWGNGYLLMGLGQRALLSIRVRLFRHIHGLDLAFFHGNPVGRLVTRVSNDVGALEEMYSLALVTIFKDIGMLLGIAAILFAVEWRLALITLAVVPLHVAVTIWFRRVSRAEYRKWRAALSRLNAFLAEALSGIRVVKLFGKERKNDETYDAIGRVYRAHFLAQRRAWAVFRPINRTLSAAGIGLVLWFGGGAALRGIGVEPPGAAAGAISIGVIVSFLAYAELFFAPIRDLTEKFDIIQSAMTAAERIFAILDEESEITDRPGAVEPERIEGAVAFRDVRFEYVEGEPVLDGVSFAIEPGRTVAIVGPTGAGKTTIINLVCRFYDVKAGAVEVDGRDVRDLPLGYLRESVAVVHQDVFLFAGTVLDNLRLGDESIPPERVREACRAVKADRFVERMEGGYEAVLEEGGKTLSAGERQLLSFARALVFDPAILVLDEATSNVDTLTEELIQAALRELTRGRTSIVIAHRLSTIQRADRILVLEGGRLVQAGTHDELVRVPGVYRRLHRLQLAGLGA